MEIGQKERSYEQRELLEKHIGAGIDLIIAKQYKDTIRHFQDKDLAGRIGYHLNVRGMSIISKELPNEQVLDNFLDYCATRMYHHLGSISGKHKEGILDMADYRDSSDFNISEIPGGTKLLQNLALLHLEEWIHVLQDFNGKPLNEGIDEIVGTGNWSEIDVALYLQRQGVSLTEEFIRRYYRKQYLDGIKTPEIFTIPNATVRRQLELANLLAGGAWGVFSLAYLLGDLAEDALLYHNITRENSVLKFTVPQDKAENLRLNLEAWTSEFGIKVQEQHEPEHRFLLDYEGVKGEVKIAQEKAENFKHAQQCLLGKYIVSVIPPSDLIK